MKMVNLFSDKIKIIIIILIIIIIIMIIIISITITITIILILIIIITRRITIVIIIIIIKKVVSTQSYIQNKTHFPRQLKRSKQTKQTHLTCKLGFSVLSTLHFF